MVYSDVVKAGMILPKKEKYTMRDVNEVLVGSLFTGNRTLSVTEAAFIVRCSAVYHNTEYSKSVADQNPLVVKNIVN